MPIVRGIQFQDERNGRLRPMLRRGIMRGRIAEAASQHLRVDDSRELAGHGEIRHAVASAYTPASPVEIVRVGLPIPADLLAVQSYALVAGNPKL